MTRTYYRNPSEKRAYCAHCCSDDAQTWHFVVARAGVISWRCDNCYTRTAIALRTPRSPADRRKAATQAELDADAAICADLGALMLTITGGAKCT